MKLVVDRSQWGRGSSSWGMVPDRCDGKMCCLGLLREACGIEISKSRGDLMQPNDIFQDICDHPLLSLLVEEQVDEDENREKIINTRWTMDVMEVNDAPLEEISDSMREYLLKVRFLEMGVEVEFVGEG